jgi:hypothetical protein
MNILAAIDYAPEQEGEKGKDCATSVRKRACVRKNDKKVKKMGAAEP